LIGNVYHFIKADSKRVKRYLFLSRSKSTNAAKIVMAREFLKIIYHVLKHDNVSPLLAEIKKDSVRII
jgi:hypothetical protein